ncbi:MAG TPA: cytochrome c [Lysobacter sp.]|nr:cytochrome c [Lysobacter sp.]
MNAPQTPASRPARAGSRYLFMLLLGLVIGAAATAYLMRLWLGEPDRFNHAVMQVVGAKHKHLNDALKANRCMSSDALPALQTLRAMANEIEPAFPDLRDDTRFVQHAGMMRSRLDAALANPPQDCNALKQATSQIGEACKACHTDFRN